MTNQPPRSGRRHARDDDDEELTPEQLTAIEAAYIEEAPAGRHSRTLRRTLDTATLPASLRPVRIGELVPSSKAGRNLPAAIVVGVGLGALILATLLLWRPGFVILVCLAVVYALYELASGIATVEARIPLVPMVVGAVAMDIVAWYRGSDGLVTGLLLTVTAVAIWRLADGALGYLRDVSAAVF